MIDLERLRANAQFALCHKGPMEVPTRDILELIDRLEAVEYQVHVLGIQSCTMEVERNQWAGKHDALAAQLHRIKCVVPEDGITVRPQDVVGRIAAIVKEAPETNLTIRDLLKQAEALEDFADDMPWRYAHTARARAARLRRQAEERRS